MLTFEDDFYLNGYKNKKISFIAGSDEAGRGPLCGPVVAGAVILPSTYFNNDINDSKKLSAKKREQLYIEITSNAIAYGIGIVPPSKIDEINIYNASRHAMELALAKLNHQVDLILTDYMPLKFNGVPVIPLVKGDAKARCIAAASILAKVTRDKIMEEYNKKYPEYEFDKHKGYPTKRHLEILKEKGIIKGFYRESYGPIKKFLGLDLPLFNKIEG